MKITAFTRIQFINLLTLIKFNMNERCRSLINIKRIVIKFRNLTEAIGSINAPNATLSGENSGLSVPTFTLIHHDNGPNYTAEWQKQSYTKKTNINTA